MASSQMRTFVPQCSRTQSHSQRVMKSLLKILCHHKPADAMQAPSTLRAFIEQQGDDCNTFYKVENQVYMLVANNAKQGSIRDFSQVLHVKLH